MSYIGGPVNQARKPFMEILPDGRHRITRWIKATTTGTIPIELGGTGYTVNSVDPWPSGETPTGWTGLRLTYIQMDDDARGYPQGAADHQPLVRLIYEEISQTSITRVGANVFTQLPDGRDQVVQDWVMFSTSTYTPETPGVSTATGLATYYLWQEDAPNDGTLRQVKRTYQTAGTVSTDDQSLQGGSLLLKKIESFYTVPATPSGYTAVGTPVQNPNGYPIYTYTFAKGAGQVSQDDKTLSGGALLIRDITYLDVPGSSNPIATPAGYTIFDAQYKDQDGYRVWSASYAKGNGEVSRRYVDAQGGTTAFNATTPSSSVGALRCIITHLTAASVTTNPTTGPASFVFIGQEIEDKDGYRVWTVTYGYGVGLILDESTTNNAGGLVTYHRVQFGSAPSTPSATIGGTVTLFSSETRNADGYIIYDYRWAEGDGEISRNFINAQGGAVSFDPATPTAFIGPVRCIIRYMTAASVTTDPTTGPTSFVRIAIDYDSRDGYKIWTVTWAYGTGLVAELIAARQDGLREVTDISIGTRTAPAGVVIRDDYRNEDGYKIYTVTSMQTAAGSGTVTGATMVFERYVPFTYPGRAKAFTETYNSRIMLDVFRSPPVTTDVKATVTVSYTTTNTIGTVSDYWNPSEWATLRSQWIGLNNEPQNLILALPGYRSTSATAVTATCSAVAPNDVSCMGNIVYGNTTAKITCTGGPANPGAAGANTWTLDVTIEPAFTDAAGTKYYRKTVVTATITDQAALPV